jgi:hypothetical protein
MTIKSFAQLDAIVDIVIANHMPDEYVLFMDKKEKEAADSFFEILSSGFHAAALPNANNSLSCDMFYYGGIKFYIVETGYQD